jgi:lipopolysaccharide/colanic/teichoic acid biosynthesis glycosyltransferase
LQLCFAVVVSQCSVQADGERTCQLKNPRFYEPLRIREFHAIDTAMLAVRHSVEGELSPKSLLPATLDAALDPSATFRTAEDAEIQDRHARKMTINPRSSIHLVKARVSAWSHSHAKRIFDCACILPVLPFLVPLFLVIGLAVRLTSSGPVLFRQKRMGRSGHVFTIVKFRTLEHREHRAHQAVTTADNQSFTPVGPFLRRWKLDELPQLWNVLRGDMSLVGARPKLPEHQIGQLQCRPGITGAATLIFAREEAFLARLPQHRLNEYYRETVLPLKHQIDVEYMSRATFSSDFKLLLDTVLRRWDPTAMESILSGSIVDEDGTELVPVITHTHITRVPSDSDLRTEQQFTEA